MKHTVNSRRVIAVITLLILSAITGVVSYMHGLDIVREVGNTGLVSYLIPGIPDLAIVAGSMTLLESSAMNLRRPPAAVAAVVIGIGWTITANVFAGVHGGVGGALIAAGVPVAFLVVLETLLWLVRNSRQEHSPESSHAPVLGAYSIALDVLQAHQELTEAASVVAEAEHICRVSALTLDTFPAIVIPPVIEQVTVPEPVREVLPPQRQHRPALMLVTAVEPVKESAVEQDAHPVTEVMTEPAMTADTKPRPKRTRSRAKTGQSSASKVVKLAARHPDMTRAQLAAKAGVSERTVRRHLALAGSEA